MANNFEILISAVDKASKTIGGVGNAMDRIGKAQKKLGAAQGKGADQSVKDSEKAGKALSEQAEKARKLEEAANGVKTAQFGMFSAAAKLLLPGSAIWAAGKMASDWSESGREISRTSASIGVSTGRLQQFRGAARLAGLSSDDMTGSLKNMGATLQDADFGRNPEVLALMPTLGMSFKRTKEGVIDTMASVFDLSRAISSIADPNIQREIAQMFGAESMLPILREGPEALNAYIQKIKELNLQSKEQIRSAEETGKAYSELWETIKGIGANFESTTFGSPAMLNSVKAINSLLQWRATNPTYVQHREGDESNDDNDVGARRRFAGKISYGADKSSVGSVVENFAKVEQKYSLPKNILAGMWGTESSFGKNLFNPTSGTIGNFQWKPETAAQYGVKPGDLDSEADGVGRYMSDLHRKRGTWKGALFDYNGVVNNVGSGEDYVQKVKKLGGTGDLDGGASAPTYTLEQQTAAIVQALNSQSVNVHVSGLPAGAKATARPASAMSQPTRVVYNMPTTLTP